MSRYTVRVETRYKKVNEIVFEETYKSFQEADAVYCLYRDLCKIPASSIQHVEFIEHRAELTHKVVSKDMEEVLHAHS
jgi:hypothetical protein